jgi:hypothetical protein
MAILEGIAATKAALEVSKLVMDLLNRPDANMTDVRSRMNELLAHVVNAQVALGDALVELGSLRTQLEDKEAQKALNADMEIETDGMFWVRKSQRAAGLIPYCPACWRKRELTLLAPAGSPGSYRCPVHQNTIYRTSQYEKWRAQQPKGPRIIARMS